MRPSVALIFDLDGTLVDSLLDITNALNAALRAHHRAPVTPDVARRWVGGGLPTLCRRAAPDLDDASISEFVEIAATHYKAHVVDHTEPYPNILEMLDLLKMEGCTLGVLSNKPEALTQMVIDRLDMRRFFTAVHGYVQDADKKPSPVVAMRIARAFDVPPERVILVGDSGTDIRTARAAGMVSAAVTWGFRDTPELLEAHPDFLVRDPLEIPKLAENFF